MIEYQIDITEVGYDSHYDETEDINELKKVIFPNGDYKFPGGGMKKGEELQDTLIREVQEETVYERNLDDYEKEYDYKVAWLPLTDIIQKNESVENYEKIPWIVRETMVMRELCKM